MKDFAYWLRVNRERAGLNQAQLAAEIAQSSSYVSMLESRRKPPPSDEVVCRIAQALDIDEERLLEVAHIERTPPDIQRKVLTLSQQVEAGARSRRTLVERLLPAALFPALATRAVDPDALPVPKKTQRLLRRVADHLGGVTDLELFAQIAVSLYEDLNADERETLLDLAGDLAAAAIGHAPAPAEGPTDAELPVFLDIPADSVEDALEESSGTTEALPSDVGPGRYGVFVTGNDLYPRIEHGDLVVIDERREPSNGDLVAVLVRGSGTLMRYLTLATHVELAPLNAQSPPLQWDEATPPEELAIRGVVLRVVRNLA